MTVSFKSRVKSVDREEKTRIKIAYRKIRERD